VISPIWADILHLSLSLLTTVGSLIGKTFPYLLHPLILL